MIAHSWEGRKKNETQDNPSLIQLDIRWRKVVEGNSLLLYLTTVKLCYLFSDLVHPERLIKGYLNCG